MLQAVIAWAIVMVAETLPSRTSAPSSVLNAMFLSKNSRARVVFVPATL